MAAPNLVPEKDSISIMPSVTASPTLSTRLSLIESEDSFLPHLFRSGTSPACAAAPIARVATASRHLIAE
jgi:hypothetical protein